MKRAGSHSGWTPIPTSDRFMLGFIMVMGLLVMVSAAVGFAGLIGWALLDLL
jgi:hypothetical protein